MKSWQKGLKLSVTFLDKKDAVPKLYAALVVWQGSLVFSEVHYFMISFLCGLFLLFFLERVTLSLYLSLFNSFSFHVHGFIFYLS